MVQNNNGRIGGGILALMIIGGAIVGASFVIPLLYSLISPLVTILLVIVIAALSLFVLSKTKSVSVTTYISTLFACICLPLIGGIIAYVILKGKGFTK